jgi:hypothetical protein
MAAFDVKAVKFQVPIVDAAGFERNRESAWSLFFVSAFKMIVITGSRSQASHRGFASKWSL